MSQNLFQKLKKIKSFEKISQNNQKLIDETEPRLIFSHLCYQWEYKSLDRTHIMPYVQCIRKFCPVLLLNRLQMGQTERILWPVR